MKPNTNVRDQKCVFFPKKKKVATSSVEVEFRALAHRICEGVDKKDT